MLEPEQDRAHRSRNPWALYRANWRFVWQDTLTDDERALIESLEDEFGNGERLLGTDVPPPAFARLNALIKNELSASNASIAIYVAIPPDLEWNGLPVHGSAGLELGLIKKYALPWNMRSAG